MDEQTFKKLYKEHAKRIYNFIIWTTGNQSIGEDILQNVFVKVWKSGSVPQDSVEVVRWLYAVARNACIDYFRSAGARKHLEFNDELDHSIRDTCDHDDARMAWKAMTSLPEIERSILFLHMKIGYSYTEIAPVLEMNENAVRVKAFRALKKLREILIKKGL